MNVDIRIAMIGTKNYYEVVCLGHGSPAYIQGRLQLGTLGAIQGLDIKFAVITKFSRVLAERKILRRPRF